jgi:lipooligosaccharide transport system permease protein
VRIGPGGLVYRHLMVHRHMWTVPVAEMVEPALYLLTIGVGVGALIGDVPETGGIGYAAYVAPALLATATMNSAVNETTFGAFHRLHVDGVYRPILATPMTARHIVIGEIAWATLRGTVSCAGFLAVVAAFGLVRSPWILLVLPGSALVAYAFAAVGMAAMTVMRRAQHLELIQLVMLPMFLCATTFYPLSVYAAPLRPVIAALPLYQSIELLRLPATGRPGAGMLVPAVYLAVLGVLGAWTAGRRMPALLSR